MNTCDTIKARQSVRAFLDKSVSDQLINQILDTARWAPSGTNLQPWQVAVVQGQTKQQIETALVQAYDAGETSRPDYAYYPEVKLPEQYQARRFACGMALYQALGIKREDRARRAEVWRLNYQAFQAPVMLLFFIDDFLAYGSYMDYGMFLQNVMLAALDLGLATCPQAALAEYPDVVRAELGEFYSNKYLLCGMALGYADSNAAVNQYRTERESVEQFTHWFN